MEGMMGITVISLINITLVLAVWGLGIYALVLLIKALKIYIKKNS
ncbi:hypothetical protein [Clostridium sp.]